MVDDGRTALGDARGIKLQLQHQPHVPHLSRTGKEAKLRSPFKDAEAHRVGQCAHFSEDEWAANLLRQAPGACRVRIRRVFVELVSMTPHTVRTEGVDEDFAVEDAADVAPAAPAPRGHQENDSDSDVDWLRASQGARPRPWQELRNQAPSHQGSNDQGPPDQGPLEWFEAELAAMLDSDADAAADRAALQQLLEGAAGDGGDEEEEASDADEGAGGNLEGAGPSAASDGPAPSPAAAADAPEHPLSSALELQCSDTPRLCQLLGVEVLPSWHVVVRRAVSEVPQNTRLGRLYCIAGRSLKAVCLLHEKCSLFLSSDGRYQETERLMIKYLCAGCGKARSEHIAQRDELQRQHRRPQGAASSRG